MSYIFANILVNAHKKIVERAIIHTLNIQVYLLIKINIYKKFVCT